MSKFIDIKNPQWANPEKTMIDVQVKVEGSDYFPYCAMACDEVEATEIFNNSIAGKYGAVAEVDTARWANVHRFKRDMLLKNSDWTQLPDVPQSVKDKWAIYRQELRDITSKSGFPLSVVFPIEPN